MTVTGPADFPEGGRRAIEAALKRLELQLERTLALLRGHSGSFDVTLSRRLQAKLAATSRALEYRFACECGAVFEYPGQLDDHGRHVHGIDP